jgi:hypothetical protein
VRLTSLPFHWKTNACTGTAFAYGSKKTGILSAESGYNSDMACAQDERLVKEYVDFVRQNIEAGTEVTRRACEVALESLSDHRRIHDCLPSFSHTKSRRPQYLSIRR